MVTLNRMTQIKSALGVGHFAQTRDMLGDGGTTIIGQVADATDGDV